MRGWCFVVLLCTAHVVQASNAMSPLHPNLLRGPRVHIRKNVVAKYLEEMPRWWSKPDPMAKETEVKMFAAQAVQLNEAQSFVESTPIPAEADVAQKLSTMRESFKWGIRFNADAKLDGKWRDIRMVFQPLHQFNPWTFQQIAPVEEGAEVPADGEEKWIDLHLNAPDTPMTATLLGLEYWSATQAPFSSIMLSWLMALSSRPGIVSRRLGKMLFLLHALAPGKRHQILRANDKATEVVDEVVAYTEFATTGVDTMFGAAPEGVAAWVELFDENVKLDFGEGFEALCESLGPAFGAIATGFFLWNAIWVDRTIAERLYSVAQGGLVWADIFIHAALATASGGTTTLVAASAALALQLIYIFGWLKERPWFQKRFPKLTGTTPEDLAAQYEERRVQVGFASLYSAFSVAENLARDTYSLKTTHPAAFHNIVLFDSPSLEDAEARMESVHELFLAFLYVLIGDDNDYHNVWAHLVSYQNFITTGAGEVVPLTLCGEVLRPSPYINPLDPYMFSSTDTLDPTAYDACRAHQQKHYKKLWAYQRKRVPCTPSEHILAFYHSIRKYNNRWPMYKKIADSTDKILQFVAAPVSTAAGVARTKVLSMIEGPRSFQTKLFPDQDMGILQVFYTLTLFHIISFREVNRQSVELKVVSDLHMAHQRAWAAATYKADTANAQRAEEKRLKAEAKERAKAERMAEAERVAEMRRVAAQAAMERQRLLQMQQEVAVTPEQVRHVMDRPRSRIPVHQTPEQIRQMIDERTGYLHRPNAARGVGSSYLSDRLKNMAAVTSGMTYAFPYATTPGVWPELPVDFVPTYARNGQAVPQPGQTRTPHPGPHANHGSSLATSLPRPLGAIRVPPSIPDPPAINACDVYDELFNDGAEGDSSMCGSYHESVAFVPEPEPVDEREIHQQIFLAELRLRAQTEVDAITNDVSVKMAAEIESLMNQDITVDDDGSAARAGPVLTLTMVPPEPSDIDSPDNMAPLVPQASHITLAEVPNLADYVAPMDGKPRTRVRNRVRVRRERRKPGEETTAVDGAPPENLVYISRPLDQPLNDKPEPDSDDASFTSRNVPATKMDCAPYEQKPSRGARPSSSDAHTRRETVRVRRRRDADPEAKAQKEAHNNRQTSSTPPPSGAPPASPLNPNAYVVSMTDVDTGHGFGILDTVTDHVAPPPPTTDDEEFPTYVSEILYGGVGGPSAVGGYREPVRHAGRSPPSSNVDNKRSFIENGVLFFKSIPFPGKGNKQESSEELSSQWV